MNDTPYYRQVLQQEFANRVSRNSRYSMRAFAKSLGTDIGAFSQILSGNRRLSYKKACEFLESLNIDPEGRENFLSSLAEEHINTGNKNISKELKKIIRYSKNSKNTLRKDLSIETYRVIADWYHFAIMELSLADNFSEDPRWISQSLGISIAQAKLAVERLVELGLMEKRQGKLKKSQVKLISKDRHITNGALKNRIKQVLNKSLEAVDNIDISERHHATMTVPIAKSKLPEAKKKIDQFLSELADFLEEDKKEEVYEIHLGMFSLQTKKD